MERRRSRDRMARTPDLIMQDHVTQVNRSPAQVGQSPSAQVGRSSTIGQPPREEGRSPTFYAVKKSRKSSMANFKTPKTLISEYLDSQKTHTALGPRHREVLVRTPDDSVNSPGHPVRSPARMGRSPGRHVQHDRVSSLRGKRTRSLTSLVDENTPRTLIEGFMAGEDTTAPVVRHLRRTSQSGISASQPVTSSARRQTSAHNSLIESDMETPRALIQGFLRNTTNVIETPVVTRDDPSPDVSPDAAIIPEAGDYTTPSPFKSSSQSTEASNITRSVNRSASRKAAGRYHIPVQVQESRPEGQENSSLSDIIQPTSPGSNASYQVPSAFLSSPESTIDMPVSQSQGALKHREGWHRRATLNLSYPGLIVQDTYHASPRSAQAEQGEDNSYIEEDEGEVIPETQQTRDRTLHEQHIIYNLPMKDNSRESADDYDDDDDDPDLDLEESMSRSAFIAGRTRMSSIEGNRRASDFDKSRKISTDSHIERFSMNRRSEVLADKSNIDEFEGGEENMDIDRMSNVSRGSLHSSLRSHNSSRSSVISYQDGAHVNRQRMREDADRRRFSDGEIIRKRRRGSLENNGEENLNGSYDLYDRHVAREGRWSEGHLIKERRPYDIGPGRYSEGHLVQGQGHLVHSKGERSFSEQGQIRNFENSPVGPVSKRRRSNISANNSFDSSNNLTPSVRSRSPKGHDLEKENQQRDEVDDYSPENNLMSRSQRQRVSGQRSFRGERSFQGHEEEGHEDYVDNEDRILPSGPGHIHTLPDNTASFSPAVASTQRLNLHPRHSPSPRTANTQRQSRLVNDDTSRFSPRVTSTQKAQSFYDGSTTVLARKQQGCVEGLPDDTASFSPRIASTQRLQTTIGERLHTTFGKRVDKSHLSQRQIDGAGPNRVVDGDQLENANSFEGEASPFDHATPQDQASLQDHATPLDQASPLEHASPSPVVSPQRDSLTPIRTPGSTGLSTRTLRSSTSMTETPGSSTSVTKTPRSSTQHTRTPGSHRNTSLRSSRLKTSPRDMKTVSSGSGGIGRGMKDGYNSQSISRFSPRMSSTQKEQNITETGVERHSAINVSSDLGGETATSQQAMPPKKKRSPRKKSQYSIPTSIVKKDFTRYAGMRVSKEAIEEVMKISEVYWDNLAGDLEAYAKHAGRKKINMDDFVLLFKRQRLINEKQCMNSLIEKYLPMEERQNLIPVARAYNKIEPKI